MALGKQEDSFLLVNKYRIIVSFNFNVIKYFYIFELRLIFDLFRFRFIQIKISYIFSEYNIF